MAGGLSPTVNNFISQNSAKGSFCRLISSTGGAGAKTAATVASGYITGMRYPDPLVLPSSFGTGVTGCIPTQILLHNAGSTSGGVMVAGLEVPLGSINVGTNVFTDGSAMPSRSLIGANNSIQSAAMMVTAVITTALSSTTPTLTITYKNQAGTGSRSASMTLPVAVALSAFSMMPHFQGTDTGVQDITNISSSGGMSGVVQFYGIIPLAAEAGIGPQEGATEILGTPMPLISLQPSDTIAMYLFSDTAIPANTSGLMIFNGIADS